MTTLVSWSTEAKCERWESWFQKMVLKDGFFHAGRYNFFKTSKTDFEIVRNASKNR